MKKVRILHVTFDMTIGGAQQVIRQLVENMDQDQFKIDIACIDGHLGELGEILMGQGFKVLLFERQTGLDYELVKQLRRLVKQNNYHVVHCHQYSPYFYGLLATLLSPAKIIFTEHGRFYPDYGTWKRKLINPIFSFFTSKIITISESTKDALVRYENFGRSSIITIYNGITDKSHIDVNEQALKKAFKIPESAFLYGTISRLQPIKNQGMMIEAFKQVHDEHSNSHLLIVGDGEIRSQLEQQVKDLDLDNDVTFTGFQKNPYRFHKIIDVFLLTSFSEGTSMTLLEALSHSKSCVVTRVGGNPEIIENKENGIVIESSDIKALALVCKDLLKNPKYRKSLETEARKSFLNRFTVDKMVTQYLDVYSEVIK